MIASSTSTLKPQLLRSSLTEAMKRGEICEACQ
jgi:hypothetical protein